MKYLFGLMCFFMMSSNNSCSDIDYNGKTRLMVKGKVTDKNGNPLQRIDVETEVYGVEISVSSDVISVTKTDANGDFVMLFPEPESGTRFRVKLVDENEVFYHKTYNNIKRENFLDLEYNLREIHLFEPVDLVNLSIRFQTNSSNRINQSKIIGSIAGDYNVNPDENWFYEHNVLAVKNQVITVEYTVRDYNNQITNHTQNIEIGTENLTYTINY